MDLFISLIAFILGTFVGSFLGVVVMRQNSGEKFVLGRSRCDFCKKDLKAYDMIPLFSFIFLQGRCRFCKRKLSMFYPAIEAVTGLSFVFVANYYSLNLFNNLNLAEAASAVLLLFIFSLLTVILFTDLKYGIIPFWAVFWGLTAALGLHMLNSFSTHSLINYFLSGAGVFLGFFIVFLITRGRGMGFGDVVYVFFMGFFLGFPEVIVGLYLAFVSGAVIALALVFLKIKKIRGDSIPFGPFLVFSTIVSFLWGNQMISAFEQYLLR